MRVFLVHHAEAVGPGVDAQRPLSAAGRRQAEWLAAHAKDRGVKPSQIWHSGKLRSRQTAEAFLLACNPFASFKLVRGLRPEDPAMWVQDSLEGEEGDVLLVGHMPSLPALARALAGIDQFPLNSMIAVERTGARHYEELWRAQPPAG